MAEEWFIFENDQQLGPIPESEMKSRAASGTLRPETLVFNISMKEWRPAGQATDWIFGPPPQIVPPAHVGSPLTAANPNQPPHALAYVSHHGELPVLSPRVIDLMKSMRPWLRLFSVLGYVFGGLMIVVGIVLSAMRTAPTFLGIIYLLLGMIYIVPAIYLGRCASKINQLEQMRRTIDLEEALAAQHAFWRFCGILFVIVIVLYLLGIAVFVAIRLH